MCIKKTLNNKRLGIVFGKAVNMNLPEGVYPLDAYNSTVMLDKWVYTITTRTNPTNNYFILEVYEEDCI